MKQLENLLKEYNPKHDMGKIEERTFSYSNGFLNTLFWRFYYFVKPVVRGASIGAIIGSGAFYAYGEDPKIGAIYMSSWGAAIDSGQHTLRIVKCVYDNIRKDIIKYKKSEN